MVNINKIIKEEIELMDTFYLIVSEGESFVWFKNNLSGRSFKPIEDLTIEEIIRSGFNSYNEAEGHFKRASHWVGVTSFDMGELKIITLDFLMRKRDEEFPLKESNEFDWIQQSKPSSQDARELAFSDYKIEKFYGNDINVGDMFTPAKSGGIWTIEEIKYKSNWYGLDFFNVKIRNQSGRTKWVGWDRPKDHMLLQSGDKYFGTFPVIGTAWFKLLPKITESEDFDWIDNIPDVDILDPKPGYVYEWVGYKDSFFTDTVGESPPTDNIEIKWVDKAGDSIGFDTVPPYWGPYHLDEVAFSNFIEDIEEGEAFYLYRKSLNEQEDFDWINSISDKKHKYTVILLNQNEDVVTIYADSINEMWEDFRKNNPKGLDPMLFAIDDKPLKGFGGIEPRADKIRKMYEQEDFDWIRDIQDTVTWEDLEPGDKIELVDNDSENFWDGTTGEVVGKGNDDYHGNYVSIQAITKDGASYKLIFDNTFDNGVNRRYRFKVLNRVNESDDFDWIRVTNTIDIGGFGDIPKDTAKIGDKLKTRKGDIFTLEEISDSDDRWVWGSDLAQSYVAFTEKNWHNPLHLTKVNDINESDDLDWIRDTKPTVTVSDMVEGQTYIVSDDQEKNGFDLLWSYHLEVGDAVEVIRKNSEPNFYDTDYIVLHPKKAEGNMEKNLILSISNRNKIMNFHPIEEPMNESEDFGWIKDIEGRDEKSFKIGDVIDVTGVRDRGTYDGEYDEHEVNMVLKITDITDDIYFIVIESDDSMEPVGTKGVVTKDWGRKLLDNKYWTYLYNDR